LLAEIFEKKNNISLALEQLQAITYQVDSKWRKRVVDMLLKIVKKDEGNIEAHDMLGKIYILQEQLGRAKTVYDHLWEIHPDSLPKVIEGYEFLLKSKPTLVDVSISLAKAYILTEHYQEAIVRLGDVLKRDPKRIKETAPLLREVIENDRKQIYLLARLYESLSLKKVVQDDPDMALAMAEAYIFEKQFDRAAQQLQRVLTLDHSKLDEVVKFYEKLAEVEKLNISVRLELVNLYIQKERYDQATQELVYIVNVDEGSLQEVIEYFYKILDKNDNLNTRHALIKTFYDHKLIDHASEECKKILAEAPMEKENSYVYLILADAYIEKGLFSDAIDKLFTVLNIDPDVIDDVKEKCERVLVLDETNVSARYALAECYIMEKNYSESVNIMTNVLDYDISRIDSIIDHVNRIIKLKHTNVDAHLALGQLYIKKGDFDRATSEFTQALELDSTKMDEVISHQKEILNLDPDSVIASFMLGKALVQKNDFVNAVEHLDIAYNLNVRYVEPVMREYQRILSIDPDNPDVKMALGKIFIAKGLYPHAIKHFSNLIENHPEWADRVIFEYRKILKKVPNLGSLHLAMAEAFFASENIEEAVNKVEFSLGIDHKLLDGSIKLLEKIACKYPMFSPAILLLSNCYVKKGNYDEASTHFIAALNIDRVNLKMVIDGLNSIISIKPDHTMSKLHLGDLYYQTGDYQKAKVRQAL
jgi:tetratricopeptide (TPR) repeat protein